MRSPPLPLSKISDAPAFAFEDITGVPKVNASFKTFGNPS